MKSAVSLNGDCINSAVVAAPIAAAGRRHCRAALAAATATAAATAAAAATATAALPAHSTCPTSDAVTDILPMRCRFAADTLPATLPTH